MPAFEVVSDFQPTGHQPQAIADLAAGVDEGLRHQTLLGVTGSGKTFTMACVIERLQRPTLVIAHNKTLAAQLSTEFKEFFPHNAVEYFVSYYDYYQPEAYVPRTDTYIEKEADINEQLDRLRHSATRALLTRRDALIVASVSCIFGLGSPEEYQGFVAYIRRGEQRSRNLLIRQLVDMQYERNDYDMSRGNFRVRGDTLEIVPAYENEMAVRIEYWGDEIERIAQLDPLTGEILGDREDVEIYPAKHFVTSEEKLELAIADIQVELEERLGGMRAEGKLLEAQRLESRTRYDLEMLRETGYCAGVENYSRHLAQREAGSTPHTLIHYFMKAAKSLGLDSKDYLLFIDESHMTIPQIRAMYGGDRSRKEVLVEHGFRLPSALDNRPLNFEEFEERAGQTVYVSATPGPYEFERSRQVVEQLIRPTGLSDPQIEIMPTSGQIDDLLYRIRARIDNGQRCLVTTLTKRMAEELADYLREAGIRAHHLHSETDTLERSEVLRDFRLGVYDVVVGINLLREGLDLPEVSLVAILDADKEGYLRSSTSLTQTIGRAARHVEGRVVMYADVITASMRRAIDETERRRRAQERYNEKHGITPQGIQKAVHDITERVQKRYNEKHGITPQGIQKAVAETKTPYAGQIDLPKDELHRLVKDLEKQMKTASKNLEFETAALLRDQIADLRKVLAEEMAPSR